MAIIINGEQVGGNLILNSNFDFWQRSTSTTLSSATKAYIPDRFFSYSNLANLPSVSQSTDVPTQTQSGWQSRYSMLTTNNATLSTPSSTQIGFIGYRLEGQDYQWVHAKTVRLQFWVKSSVTGTYGLTLTNSGYTRSYLTTYTISVASTWTQIVMEITLDSSGTWNFDNTIGLEIDWILSVGTGQQNSTLNAWQTTTTASIPYAANTSVNWAGTASATFELSQVMLVPIDSLTSQVSLPYQRAGRSVGHELQMCQRYYEKSYEIATLPGTNTGQGRHTLIAQGYNATSLNISNKIQFKASKRIAPTFANFWDQGGTSGVWDPASGSSSLGITITAIYGQIVDQSGIELAGNGTGMATNQIFPIIGHWSADAEL